MAKNAGRFLSSQAAARKNASTANGAANLSGAYSGRTRKRTAAATTEERATKSAPRREKLTAAGERPGPRPTNRPKSSDKGGSAITRKCGVFAATNGNSPSAGSAHQNNNNESRSNPRLHPRPACTR